MRELIGAKIGLLRHSQEYKGLLDYFDPYIEGLLTDREDCLYPLSRLFYSVVAELCLQEGVGCFSSQEDEMALKDRLPDTVAGWVSVMLTLFGAGETSFHSSMQVISPKETAGLLMLRLLEWKYWNYEGRLLYGSENERLVREAIARLPYQMEMTGEMEDAAHILVSFLNSGPDGSFALNPAVRHLFMDFSDREGRHLSMGASFITFDRTYLAVGPEESALALESLEYFHRVFGVGVV